jgi:hypothetical protein
MLEYVFCAIVGFFAAYMLYQVVRNKGFRGAMFGAPVADTVGDLDLGRRGMVRTRLKVHRLESKDATSPEVGVEFVTSTIGSWHMFPVALTRSEAVALSTLLSQAAAQGPTIIRELANDELPRTRNGSDGASPLISVLGRT